LTIEYQIVWVDDSPDWVASVIGEIRDYVNDHGFAPNIKTHTNSEGFLDRCSSVDVDLIIVDFNLSEATDGSRLISELRTTGVFKAVVFYSQDGPSSRQMGATDGVFYCTRDDAVDKIKRAIDLTVHKLRDLDVVRGLIIASTIDLEAKLEELMITVFGDRGTLFQEKVLEKGLYDFEKKMKFMQSHFKDLVSKAGASKKTELNAISKKLRTFGKDVVDQRNILAHVRKTTWDGKTELKGMNDRTKKIIFDEDWLSDTRRKIREHRENLENIEAVLGE